MNFYNSKTKVYAELYKNHSNREEQELIPKVLNLGSDDIPEIISKEIRSALTDMKNNKAPIEGSTKLRDSGY